MKAYGSDRLRVVADSRREPLVPDAAIGTLIFVFAELMLFAGLISAFTIVRSAELVWPPPGQPRLPVQETALNTAALLASGVFLFLAQRCVRRQPRRATLRLLATIVLGAFFVAFQGAEWLALVRQGLTLTSSILGSFFYLIVGLHALHAVAALGFLVHVWVRLRQGWLSPGLLDGAAIFWYFVVGVWPVLYWRVYL